MNKLIALLFLTPMLSFADVHFYTGSSTLTKELSEEITKVFNEKIKGKDIDSIIVEGHTDARGSDKANLKLSKARAEAAANKLVELGANRSKITVVGKGESELVSTGNSDLDHAKNRRVVIIVGNDVTVLSEHKQTCNCPSKEVIVEKIKRHNNILSLVVVRSLSEYDISSNSPTSWRVENRYEYVPGVMYQRGVSDNVYLGIQVDLHKSIGGSLGYGF